MLDNNVNSSNLWTFQDSKKIFGLNNKRSYNKRYYVNNFSLLQNIV